MNEWLIGKKKQEAKLERKQRTMYDRVNERKKKEEMLRKSELKKKRKSWTYFYYVIEFRKKKITTKYHKTSKTMKSKKRWGSSNIYLDGQVRMNTDFMAIRNWISLLPIKKGGGKRYLLTINPVLFGKVGNKSSRGLSKRISVRRHLKFCDVNFTQNHSILCDINLTA